MRWWTDRETSLRMLDLVDDSNMEQGVATCVLGYHGIMADALAPLGRQSLVDPGLVQAAAEQVDITPVAKALGRATRPVLGAAAAKYGELLAKSEHARAVDDTTRLIIALTSSGLPTPLAVDRAIAVHGVPMKGMGKYAFQMKAPVVTEVVKADLADRALMLWARDLASRERMGGRASRYDRAR
jgi:hypothetical protein